MCITAGNMEGVLVPFYTKGKPKAANESHYLGSVSTSPIEIREQTVNHELNGTSYQKVNCNCQTWLIAFAEMFGRTILQRMKSHGTSEDGLFGGLLAGALTLFFLWLRR